MKKELGEVTLYELARECEHQDYCDKCPFGHTKLNCWRSYKLLRDNILEEEVDL